MPPRSKYIALEADADLVAGSLLQRGATRYVVRAEVLHTSATRVSFLAAEAEQRGQVQCLRSSTKNDAETISLEGSLFRFKRKTWLNSTQTLPVAVRTNRLVVLKRRMRERHRAPPRAAFHPDLD